MEKEKRGEGSNTRYVCNILPEIEPADSLLVVEVITPSGNWSSYPPHKHDQDNLPTESYLEETYYHRINPSQGYVTQRVYTDDLSINEKRRKSIAFTFGRFNPPTSGHEKLINKVASVRADTFKIYLSRSNDPKKNPLSPRTKLTHMKMMFPRYSRNIEINNTNMILDIASKLHRQGYTEIFMVVGSDRVREFETILNKYNDVRSRHGYYNFDNINVLLTLFL